MLLPRSTSTVYRKTQENHESTNEQYLDPSPTDIQAIQWPVWISQLRREKDAYRHKHQLLYFDYAARDLQDIPRQGRTSRDISLS